MAIQLTHYSKEEIAQLGNEIYERDIRPKVEAGNYGRVVAIDVRTGDYELADDVLTSAIRLRARLPEAEVWMMRVGYPTLRVFRFGLRRVSRRFTACKVTA